MKRNKRYAAYIVDLDGTLYYQPPVQICMALSILFFLITNPLKWHEIQIVREYRKLYKKGIHHTARYERLSEKHKIPLFLINEVIQKWMTRKPLPYILKFRDKRLLASLTEARRRGIGVIVYSDYPVTDKLNCLRFRPDAAYSAEDIGCLKPAAEGLRRILEKHHLSAADCLFIGDTPGKDGQCAVNVKMDYVILSKCSLLRRIKKDAGKIP